MKSSIKIVLCKYYTENRCKFKNSPDLCTYAHGVDDLKLIDCKFGVRCINVDCKFYHGNINVYKLEIMEPVIKIKKNKKKYKVNKTFIKEIDNRDYYNIYKEMDLLNNIDIYNNSNKLSEIKKIDKLDKYINIIIEKNKMIYRLKNQLKKQNKYGQLEDQPKKQNNYNLILYNKYSKIYNISKDKNYNQLKNISKDKNIYKLKLRSQRVKEYIDIVKKYNVKDLLPISYILNSTKISFSNILQNIINHINI